MNQNKNLRSSR